MNLGVTGDAGLIQSPGRLTWPRLNLVWQFTLVSSVVVLLGLIVQGSWIAKKIEESVKLDAGVAAALYMDSFIAPSLKAFAQGSILSPEVERSLDEVMQSASMRMRVAAIKIWTRDGRILYSSNKQLIGRRFVPKEDLLKAAQGFVSVEFDDLDHDENFFERSAGSPLIEIYAPIRDSDGRVVAVAEFYERADVLGESLASARRQSWLMTGSVSLGMMFALFWIVARGNDTIEAQRRALSKRVAQLSDLLTQNEQLRDRVQRASQLATEGNERFLRRLGSDLHDGPAQLISYSLLQLNTLKPIAKCELDETSFRERLHAIRSALTDAMAEVRNICAGLTLPEIETRPFADVLMFVIREHERRTRTVVTFAASDLPAKVPQFVKICLCRFIQEGLNNAFRHADGKGQRVVIKTGRNSILVEVVDQGPGIKIHDRPSDRVCLGLPGLRDRIESLGGTLQIDSQPGIGTRLIAQLPVVTGGQ